MSKRINKQKYEDPIELLSRFMMRDKYLMIKDFDLWKKMRTEYGLAIKILVDHEIKEAKKLLK